MNLKLGNLIQWVEYGKSIIKNIKAPTHIMDIKPKSKST